MRFHDYRARGWGHDYVWTPDENSGGKAGRFMGSGHGLQNGDVLVLQGREPNLVVLYKISQVSYFPDPPDMWKCRGKYAPKLINKLKSTGFYRGRAFV